MRRQYLPPPRCTTDVNDVETKVWRVPNGGKPPKSQSLRANVAAKHLEGGIGRSSGRQLGDHLHIPSRVRKDPVAARARRSHNAHWLQAWHSRLFGANGAAERSQRLVSGRNALAIVLWTEERFEIRHVRTFSWSQQTLWCPTRRFCLWPPCR